MRVVQATSRHPPCEVLRLLRGRDGEAQNEHGVRVMDGMASYGCRVLLEKEREGERRKERRNEEIHRENKKIRRKEIMTKENKERMKEKRISESVLSRKQIMKIRKNKNGRKDR